MTSRARVAQTLDHREPDRVPLDLGGGPVTGMHVNSVYALRQALGLDPPGTPVKVIQPHQMLGEIGLDLIEALGVDVVPLTGSRTVFGYEIGGWKPWTTFQGVPVLVPAGFNTDPEPNGDLLMYPEGDRSAPPSGRMPRGGWYFDAIVRQPPIDESRLNPEDNVEEFGPISDREIEHLRREADRLFTQTKKAILASFGGTSFGDIARVPATMLKHPRGIRDIEEWYTSLLTRRDYIYRVFERQCEIGLANLGRIHAAVGDRVTAVLVTGADFGAQQGPFIAPAVYCDLFKPFHAIVNGWIHAHTGWKTFIHSCGSVRALIPHFIEAGFDILNPVQCSAADMGSRQLKREFGDKMTFWGAGVDTQQTLPFGTPQAVRAQVRERMRIFRRGGGFVFATVHNIQAAVPAENLRALFDAVDKYR